MLNEDPEAVHRNNLTKLSDLYGLNKEQEIRDLYQQSRAELESKASIQDHIPFFTYQQTETILKQRYGKPQKQLHQSGLTPQEQPQTRPKSRSRLLRLLRL